MGRVAKRKTTHKGESTTKPVTAAEGLKNEPSQSLSQPTEENHLQEGLGNAEPEPSYKAATVGRCKRARVTKPETETEYFPEKRSLEPFINRYYGKASMVL